jgi:omega-6 fatty acid desaturase (delta-12 desaturase)
MQLHCDVPAAEPAAPGWQKLIVKYQAPDLRRSVWQIVNSVGPYLGLWYLMYLSLSISYALTLLLALIASGFLIRIFIILHDCGHGAFFKSHRANESVGFLCGVLTFTPYHQWRRNHALHHAHSSDLDRRATWDLPLTLTVKEYLQLPRWKQLLYRLYRHPLILLGVAPALLFIVAQRFTSPGAGKRERWGVFLTNLALLALAVVLSGWVGWKAYLLVQLPVLLFAATIGVWLFYIQHQFEDTYWERGGEWDYVRAAMQGSSYYKLPRLLQWFTGNIGLHHIHHLSSRVPNYALQQCHDENPIFQRVSIITFWASLQALSLRLWDEEQQKLVGFGHLKSIQSI